MYSEFFHETYPTDENARRKLVRSSLWPLVEAMSLATDRKLKIIWDDVQVYTGLNGGLYNEELTETHVRMSFHDGDGGVEIISEKCGTTTFSVHLVTPGRVPSDEYQCSAVGKSTSRLVALIKDINAPKRNVRKIGYLLHRMHTVHASRCSHAYSAMYRMWNSFRLNLAAQLLRNTDLNKIGPPIMGTMASSNRLMRDLLRVADGRADLFRVDSTRQIRELASMLEDHEAAEATFMSKMDEMYASGPRWVVVPVFITGSDRRLRSMPHSPTRTSNKILIGYTVAKYMITHDFDVVDKEDCRPKLNELIPPTFYQLDCMPEYMRADLTDALLFAGIHAKQQPDLTWAVDTDHHLPMPTYATVRMQQEDLVLAFAEIGAIFTVWLINGFPCLSASVDATLMGEE
jgi:hypothetical protein